MPNLPDERLAKEPTSPLVGNPIHASPDVPGYQHRFVRQVDIQLPGLAGDFLQGQVHCPFCLKIIEITPIGLSTFLGPSLLQCPKCGQFLISHRREWNSRSSAGKAWYVAVSLVYVGFCTAISFGCTWLPCAVARSTQMWLPGRRLDRVGELPLVAHRSGASPDRNDERERWRRGITDPVFGVWTYSCRRNCS